MMWPDDTPEWVRCTEPVLVVNGDVVRVVMDELWRTTKENP